MRRAVVAALAGALLAAAWPAAAAARTSGDGDERLPAFGEFVQVEELPQVLRRVAPECPQPAPAASVGGTVMVQALVGKDGRVKDTRIVKSVPLLDSAAVAAVRQWIFSPARTEGKPVAVWVAVPLEFVCGTGEAPPPAPAPTEDELRHLLVQEVLLLQERGPCLPSPADTALRRRIIRDALACDPRPMIPDSARLHLARGRRALGHCACHDSVRFAEGEFTAALHQAPWWGEAYQRLANTLLRQVRNGEAGLCLDLYLGAEPDAPDRVAVERRVAKLLKRPSGAR